MQSNSPTVLLAMALALLAGTARAALADSAPAAEPATSALGHGGHHGHHSPVSPAGVPADHVPWATDAPLRDGMRRMRDAIAGVGHDESGQSDQDQALVAATEVDQAAAYMFANCTLAAEPDAALHGLLARLMAGAQALRQHPVPAAALASMRATLVDYAQLFDDDTLLWAEPAHGDG
jgi:hypothetical protein